MLRKLTRLVALTTTAAALPLAVPGPSAQAVLPPCTRNLSIADHRADEGTTAAGPPTIFTFTIASSGCSAPGRIDFATKWGTATPGDFTPTDGTISFPQGDMSARSISVAVSPDSTPEREERFIVKICRPTSIPFNAIVITRAEAVGLIVNDDEGELHEPGNPPHELKCSENPQTIVR